LNGAAQELRAGRLETADVAHIVTASVQSLLAPQTVSRAAYARRVSSSSTSA
jgi:hypothetical protein